MKNNLIWVLGLCACSSSGGASSITIEGDAFTVPTANAGIITDSTGSEYAQIILSSQSDDCTQIGSGIQHPNRQTIILDVGNGSAAPTATGAYTVSTATTGQYAQVFAQSTDANCQGAFVPQPNGASGTVTLASIAGSAMSGSFDVVLDTNDHVTGNFAAASCPAIGSASNDPTCK